MKKLFLTVCISLLYSFVYGQVPEMVTVEGGSFNMGDDEFFRPKHFVTISSFKMGKFEVTVAQFAAFIKATGFKTDAEKQGNSKVFVSIKCADFGFSVEERSNDEDGITWRDDEVGHRRNDSEWNMPVIHVSWNDAIAYCQWLSHKTGKNYRLPTEAEWEYAAGNGTKHTTYSWGNFLPGSNDAVGNVADETVVPNPRYGSWGNQKFIGYTDGYYFASPVGSYTSNDFGLYDMTGNVREWCNDWYDEKYYGNSPLSNPEGPEKGKARVNRGGSWCESDFLTKVIIRSCCEQDKGSYNIGFRVVCSH